MAGKLVSQSLYVVSMTKDMALFKNASMEAAISMKDPYQEARTHASQNTLQDKYVSLNVNINMILEELQNNYISKKPQI